MRSPSRLEPQPSRPGVRCRRLGNPELGQQGIERRSTHDDHNWTSAEGRHSTTKLTAPTDWHLSPNRERGGYRLSLTSACRLTGALPDK